MNGEESARAIMRDHERMPQGPRLPPGPAVFAWASDGSQLVLFDGTPAEVRARLLDDLERVEREADSRRAAIAGLDAGRYVVWRS